MTQPDVRLQFSPVRHHPANRTPITHHASRITHHDYAPRHDEPLRFQARATVPPGAEPDWWEVLRDTPNEALPPGRARKAGG